MKWNKEEIRVLRMRLGWSQNDLARRLQTTPMRIDQWEDGAQTPEIPIQQELELLIRQAYVCSEETMMMPAAEIACDSSAVDQIDFSCVKEGIQ